MRILPHFCPNLSKSQENILYRRPGVRKGNRPVFTLEHPVLEFVLRGLIVYFFLLFLVRLSGKRQIGQHSPFDLILLLILANAVENSLVGGDESVTGGLVAATTLVVVNYCTGLAAEKSKGLENVLEGKPQILIYKGTINTKVMHDAHMSQLELDTTLREAGYFDVKDVKIAVLETTGKISILGFDSERA